MAMDVIPSEMKGGEINIGDTLIRTVAEHADI